MTEPARLDHAKGFTNQEILTLATWLEAAQAELTGLKGRILSTGLLAEHYESLLADDPADRTAEELTILATLQAEAQAARDALDDVLGRPHGPHYP